MAPRGTEEDTAVVVERRDEGEGEQDCPSSSTVMGSELRHQAQDVLLDLKRGAAAAEEAEAATHYYPCESSSSLVPTHPPELSSRPTGSSDCGWGGSMGDIVTPQEEEAPPSSPRRRMRRRKPSSTRLGGRFTAAATVWCCCMVMRRWTSDLSSSSSHSGVLVVLAQSSPLVADEDVDFFLLDNTAGLGPEPADPPASIGDGGGDADITGIGGADVEVVPDISVSEGNNTETTTTTTGVAPPKRQDLFAVTAEGGDEDNPASAQTGTVTDEAGAGLAGAAANTATTVGEGEAAAPLVEEGLEGGLASGEGDAAASSQQTIIGATTSAAAAAAEEEAEAAAANAVNPVNVENTETAMIAAGIDDPCSLPADVGPCDDVVPSYYHDVAKASCELFEYGGCDGNGNRFETMEECEGTCLTASSSSLASSQGQEPVVATDVTAIKTTTTKTTMPAVVANGLGEGGNDDKEASATATDMEEPQDPQDSSSICTLPPEVGMCKAAFPRFYYKNEYEGCQEFTYGGCDGNENNFETMDECKAACSSGRATPVPPTVPVTTTIAAGNMSQGVETSRVEVAATTPVSTAIIEPTPPDNAVAVDTRIGVGTENATDSASTQQEQGTTLTTVDDTSDPQEEVDVCTLPFDQGPCDVVEIRYYHSEGKCQMGTYGGCEGNGNNFASMAECEETCVAVGTIGDTTTSGTGEASAGNSSSLPVPPTTQAVSPQEDVLVQEDPSITTVQPKVVAVPTTTVAAEEELFTTTMSSSICNLPKKVGPCEAAMKRWFHDGRTCVAFTYGGCQGNENNFNTEMECQMICPPSEMAPLDPLPPLDGMFGTTVPPDGEPTPQPTPRPNANSMNQGEEDMPEVPDYPTVSPTMAPTLTSVSIDHLTMTIESIEPLSPSEGRKSFTDAATAHVLEYWKDSTLIQDLEVRTLFVGQDPPYEDPAGGDGLERRRQRRMMLRRRQLQSSLPPLLVRYSQEIAFRPTPFADVDLLPTPTNVALRPFEKLKYRLDFIQLLKSTGEEVGLDPDVLGDAASVSRVKVVPPPPPPRAPAGADGASEGGISDDLLFYIIVGSASGGAAVILTLLVCCICKRRNARRRRQMLKGDKSYFADDATRASSPGLKSLGGTKRNRRKGAKKLEDDDEMMDDAELQNNPMMMGGQHPLNPLGPNAVGGPSAEAKNRVNETIDVQNMRDDDISTLGDPLSPYKDYGLIRSTTKESMASTIQYDFDYSKNFGGAAVPSANDDPINVFQAPKTDNLSHQSLVATGTATTAEDRGENSVFSDDDSFERQFGYPEERIEIRAPPGKLGVVIDTFDGGVAGVNAIKDDSILADRLRIGDILVSVDGEETAGMSAMQVSKMIGQKCDQNERVLVFVRKLQA